MLQKNARVTLQRVGSDKADESPHHQQLDSSTAHSLYAAAVTGGIVCDKRLGRAAVLTAVLFLCLLSSDFPFPPFRSSSRLWSVAFDSGTDTTVHVPKREKQRPITKRSLRLVPPTLHHPPPLTFLERAGGAFPFFSCFLFSVRLKLFAAVPPGFFVFLYPASDSDATWKQAGKVACRGNEVNSRERRKQKTKEDDAPGGRFAGCPLPFLSCLCSLPTLRRSSPSTTT